MTIVESFRGSRRGFPKPINSDLYLTAAVFAMAVIIMIDLWTGKIPISAPYVLTVAFVSWFAGLRYGFAFTLIGVIAQGIVSQSTGIPHSSPIFFLIDLGQLAVVNGVIAFLASYARRLLQDAREREFTDDLTQIANRKGFGDALGRELLRFERYRRSFAVALIDLDNFKKVNDTLGHLVGNELLKIVAHTMRDNLRKADLAARWGGDEFMLLLPEVDRKHAECAIEKIRMVLLSRMTERGWPVTFSIGVAVVTELPESAEAVEKAADALMYLVKTSTKDGVRVGEI